MPWDYVNASSSPDFQFICLCITVLSRVFLVQWVIIYYYCYVSWWSHCLQFGQWRPRWFLCPLKVSYSFWEHFLAQDVPAVELTILPRSPGSFQWGIVFRYILTTVCLNPSVLIVSYRNNVNTITYSCLASIEMCDLNRWPLIFSVWLFILVFFYKGIYRCSNGYKGQNTPDICI